MPCVSFPRERPSWQGTEASGRQLGEPMSVYNDMSVRGTDPPSAKLEVSAVTAALIASSRDLET